MTCDAADYPHNCDSEYLKLLKYFEDKCFATKRTRCDCHDIRQYVGLIAEEEIKIFKHPALYTPPIYYSRYRVLSAVFNVIFSIPGKLK